MKNGNAAWTGLACSVAGRRAVAPPPPEERGVCAVTQYLAELYLSRTGATDLPAIVARARGAAESLAREGIPVRCVRSTFVPDDETWFLLYEGTSAFAVAAALARAGLRCTRVIEAVEQW